MQEHDLSYAPIGVFDSGVGGLTVAREIMRQMPDERIIYFGDTARGDDYPFFQTDYPFFAVQGSQSPGGGLQYGQCAGPGRDRTGA